MPEIPAGFANVAIEMVYGLDPDPMYVTFGIETSGGAANDVAQGIQDAIDGTLNSFVTSAVAFTRTIVTSPITVGESTDGQTGGAISDPSLPQNNAILLKKLSGLRGRTNRGRMYVPGVQENNISDEGFLDPSFATGAQAGIDDFDAAVRLVTDVADLVILHAEGSVQPPTPITQWVVDPRIATQRRRLR